MFNVRAPEIPTTCIYTIRPYQTEDEVRQNVDRTEVTSGNCSYAGKQFAAVTILLSSYYTLHLSLIISWMV